MKKYLILSILFLCIFSFAEDKKKAKEDLDVYVNTTIEKGNKEKNEYSGKLLYETNNIEIKGLAEYEKEKEEESDKKYEGFGQYEDKFDKRWSWFTFALIGQDTKKEINIQTKEVAGIMYEFFPGLKYSLGVGHKRKDNTHTPIASHRLKFEYVKDKFKIKNIDWMFNNLNDSKDTQITSETSLTTNANDWFEYGISVEYEYDNNVKEDLSKYDLKVKAMIVIHLMSN